MYHYVQEHFRDYLNAYEYVCLGKPFITPNDHYYHFLRGIQIWKKYFRAVLNLSSETVLKNYQGIFFKKKKNKHCAHLSREKYPPSSGLKSSTIYQ